VRTQRSLVRTPVHALCLRMRDDVPLLGALRTSAVIGAPLPRGDTRCKRRTDRGPGSDDPPRRVSPFPGPGCLSPSRHAKELREGSDPSGPRAGSLAHAAHTFSPEGERALDGHCKVTVRSPARRESRECRHLFDSLDCPRLGLTTQARHRARPARPSAGTVCPARIDAGRSA
jgi:hypothetical protein